MYKLMIDPHELSSNLPLKSVVYLLFKHCPHNLTSHLYQKVSPPAVHQNILRIQYAEGSAPLNPSTFGVTPDSSVKSRPAQQTKSTSPGRLQFGVIICYNRINPNLTTGFTGLVGKVRKKLSPEGGREGGEKKRAQRARRARGSNPGPAAC